MKKVALSLAGVMAVAAFAPEASALPLFARQTGMACNACHFQHFPMLNGFGRSFKASGFTLMGAQGKVEGENLSIPDTLNLAVLTTAGYSKNNGTAKSATLGTGLKNPADGMWYVPGTGGEFSLFIGGRTSDNSGALAEVGLTQAGGLGAGLASAKIPMLWEVADGTRVGVVPFTTDAQGASYGFEELNTGANAVHTMLFAGGDFNGSIGGTLSAQQYIGTGGSATGLALVANNSMGFINVTKYSGLSANGTGGGAALTSTYLRVAGTFDLAGWDAGAGIQSWSGSSTTPTNTGTAALQTLSNTKATAIDGQMQGEIAGMPVGFYASYARAPASGVVANVYNPGNVSTKSSFNISTEWGVIPEKATLGAAIRRAKNGAGAGVDGDNAYLLEGSYKLAQNMMLQLVYTKQSGSAWTAGPGATGDTQTTFNLATIF
ncbi:MAG: hypothetical protein GC139_06250 [Sideroxydans sp.]|nr:hypothetical protein [Sideroxydans sp.]